MTVPLICLIPVWGALAGSYALFLDPYFLETGGQVYWEFRNVSSHLNLARDMRCPARATFGGRWPTSLYAGWTGRKDRKNSDQFLSVAIHG